MGSYYFPDFNIFNTNIYTMNFPAFFNIFDFQPNNTNILEANTGMSVFEIPQLIPNFVFQPPQFLTPIIQPLSADYLPEMSVAKTDKKPEITEPQETDAEITRAEKVTASAVQTNPKTQKAEKRLARSGYVTEEIVPGCYIHKMKYVNTKDLKPYMKETLAKLSKKAEELGYTLVVSDGFRSHQQQINLKKRKPKLAATPGKSAHEYGVAVDIGLAKNGKLVGDIYKKVPEFGRYAQSLGLEWGATWKTKYEPWHFNFQNWQELADVKNEYRQWNHIA